MPNPRNSKNRQPSPIRLPYVRFDAGYHLARIIDMAPPEAGDYFRRLLIALNTGQRGIMPEADAMMDEAQAYFDAKRRAGSTGGKRTQSKRESTASSTASSHTDRHTGIQAGNQTGTHTPKTKPREPGESVSVRESVCMSLGIQDSPELRQETIENLAPDELPVWASNFCQESDPVQAAFAYRKQLHRIGAETFREELSAFVAELDGGGEEPDSRGAAFMSRLKDIEAKQPRAGHE